MHQAFLVGHQVTLLGLLQPRIETTVMASSIYLNRWTYLHQCSQLCHGNLLGSLNSHGHLLLMFSIQEWKNLSDNGVQSLTDLRLFVHFDIQAIGHFVVLNIFYDKI